QVKNQDYFFKQQASYIKNNPNDNSNNVDVDKDNTSELNQSESTDDEIKMSLQPDVNDLTTYEFKEIDLDFDEASYNSDEQDIGQDMSEPYEDEHVHDQVFENEENATFEEVVEVEESDVSEQSHHEMSEQSSEVEQFEEQVDQEHEVINPVEENDTEALNNHIDEAHSEIIEESNHFVEDDISFEDFDVLEDSEPSSEEAFGLVDETLLESPQDEEAQNTQDIDDQHESNVQFEEVEKSEEKQTYEPVLKPNPTRKSSPFNVLMTPSDKRKHQTFKNDIKRKENNESNSQVVQENKENNESEQATKRKGPLFVLPPVSILDDVVEKEDNSEWLEDKKKELDEAFYHFNVPAHVVNMIQGPTVTRFELSVEKGVKVSRITALQDDIKMALAAKDIRIEAPIPGTSLVGIEVPNQSPKKIPLGQMITSKAFQQAESKLTVAMGFKINNEPLLMDISKTPHALIAGATGSGKSVCINAILTSLLYKNHPDELKLLLIDPKMVELAPYNNLPHLVAPVITDVKAATASLKWAVEEMERRYKRFAELHVRNITAFNKKANYEQRMAKIIIVIDELADLMMMSPQEVEQSIARIAQKARACGIHMILATQRPSVNVITGLIKANVPTRISFMVSSSIDSRTILDVGGAEKLLGNGDMLYLGNGMNKPIRVQGAFVSDDEIDETVSNVSNQMKPNYLFKEETLLKKVNEQPKDALFND
ncbi:DNA translocase FtsK, partial [Mammaliicoccus fleurettii]|nr:DNA translocase FtsK [Mammaliicoccus fleurettii]